MNTITNHGAKAKEDGRALSPHTCEGAQLTKAVSSRDIDRHRPGETDNVHVLPLAAAMSIEKQIGGIGEGEMKGQDGMRPVLTGSVELQLLLHSGNSNSYVSPTLLLISFCA